ncbi:MAG: hypothetical protein K0U38_08080 [Epsilonproteobacteria bacterium]|nr:hypothetical protein [Campylobacterota bacterium]
MSLSRNIFYLLLFSTFLLGELNQTVEILEGNITKSQTIEANSTVEEPDINTSTVIDDINETVKSLDINTSLDNNSSELNSSTELKEEKNSITLTNHIERSSHILVATFEKKIENNTTKGITESLLFQPSRVLKGDVNSSILVQAKSFSSAIAKDEFLLFLKQDTNKSNYTLTDINSSALPIKEQSINWIIDVEDINSEKKKRGLEDVVDQIEEVLTPPEEPIPDC